MHSFVYVNKPMHECGLLDSQEYSRAFQNLQWKYHSPTFPFGFFVCLFFDQLVVCSTAIIISGRLFLFFFFLKINLYLAALLYAGFPQLWKVRATLDAVHQLLVTVAPLIAAREIQLIYKSSLRQTTEEDKPLASKMAHRVCLLLSNYLMF